MKDMVMQPSKEELQNAPTFKECRFKKLFVNPKQQILTGLCNLEYPSCMKDHGGACYYYDKYMDLSMDAESVMTDWRAERGGKE